MGKSEPKSKIQNPKSKTPHIWFPAGDWKRESQSKIQNLKSKIASIINDTN